MGRAHVLVVGANLLFTSKVTATANALGLTAESASAEMAVALRPLMVIVDLEQVSPAIVRDLKQRSGARLVGFASHAETEVLFAGRAAGCDQVLSKGQLSASLRDLLEPFRPAPLPGPKPR